MKRIELRSPILRDRELPYQEFDYPIVSTQFLPEPSISNSVPFLEVINRRRSKRNFNSLAFEQLNALLWHSARTIDLIPPIKQIRWEHRPSPSGGGRHPIDVFILKQGHINLELHLYQSISHALSLLRTDHESVKNLMLEAERILPPEEATILWFGAQFERTLSRYEYGDSIVWKDAGALTATFSFVAEAFNLNFCPIGITGEPYFSQCLKTTKLTGMGGACVGSQ